MVVAPDYFHQKQGDRCFIEKCLRNQVHPPPVVLDLHKAHCNNHWNVSIKRLAWQTNCWLETLPLLEKPNRFPLRINWNG